jgi:uncharacterized protein (DUF2062 family)
MSHRLLEHAQSLMARGRTWLDRHPRTTAALERTGCLRIHRRGVARGVAIGLFVALTPTVGVQTLMMLGACLLVRANFPVAFGVSWISNPITMAPLYYGYHLLGDRLFSPIIETGLDLAGYGERAAIEAVYLALGGLLVALPLSIAGYFLTNWGWRRWVVHRRAQKLLQSQNKADDSSDPPHSGEPRR